MIKLLGTEASNPRNMATNKRKSSFYPIGSLEGKTNFKEYASIDRDGTITEKVFLNVLDPSEREMLICFHYMRHMVRNFYEEGVGVNILSRDCPWDFSLEFSTGETTNVEITSIADMREHFIINKSEERFLKWKSEEYIPLHELEKLNRMFPDASIKNAIESFKNSGLSDNSSIENPLYKNGKTIFISNMPERQVLLAAIVREAIEKKLQKPHSDKDKTILLIDNRTSIFEVSDYKEAVDELSEYCGSLPFPEVWFYTGYYSDNDGNNAEFSFAPLKATSKQWKILSELVTNNKTDESGKYVW
jgi:hypothetical protein